MSGIQKPELASNLPIEVAPESERLVVSPNKMHNRLVLTRRIVCGIAGVALLLPAADAGLTYVLDPPDKASAHILEGDEDDCLNSKFAMAYDDPTGLETDQWAAAINHDLVKRLGGCSIYMKYGQRLNIDDTARAFTDMIRSITPPGQKKKVILSGPSLGGMIWEEVISQQSVMMADYIDLEGIVMEASPTGMPDVKEDVLGVPVKEIHLPDVVPFGKGAVFLNNLNEQRKRGDALKLKSYYDTWVNTGLTRPQLTVTELELLRKGDFPIRNDVPIWYIQSPDSDPTIMTEQALVTLRKITKATITDLAISGGGHAAMWLNVTYLKYKEAYEKAVTESLAGKSSEPAK